MQIRTIILAGASRAWIACSATVAVADTRVGVLHSASFRPATPRAIMMGPDQDTLEAPEVKFRDTFSTISPAWSQSGFDPAGFEAVKFDGKNRLRLTFDATGSSAHRPAPFKDGLYMTQGRQRPVGLSGRWTLSAEVFVASAFNTATGPLARSELRSQTGPTPEDGSDMMLGFTNASPTDEFNPIAADRAFRFRVSDGNTGNWINLKLPAGFAFEAWHTLVSTSNGTTVEYSIDGTLVHTSPVGAGGDLRGAMIQGCNFDQTDGYSVYWDNVTASTVMPQHRRTWGQDYNFISGQLLDPTDDDSLCWFTVTVSPTAPVESPFALTQVPAAVPEPVASGLMVAASALGLACWFRRLARP